MTNLILSILIFTTNLFNFNSRYINFEIINYKIQNIKRCSQDVEGYNDLVFSPEKFKKAQV